MNNAVFAHPLGNHGLSGHKTLWCLWRLCTRETEQNGESRPFPQKRSATALLCQSARTAFTSTAVAVRMFEVVSEKKFCFVCQEIADLDKKINK